MLQRHPDASNTRRKRRRLGENLIPSWLLPLQDDFVPQHPQTKARCHFQRISPAKRHGGAIIHDKNVVQNAVNDTCRSLFSDSMVPGLRIIFGKTCWLRRLVWLLICIILLVVSVTEFYKILRDSLNRRDSIVINEVITVDQFLPAVTICNLNPFRRSKYCAYTFPKTSNISRGLQRLLCDGTFSEPWNDIMLDRVSAWLGTVNITISDYIMSRKHRDLINVPKWGHQLNDTIIECYIEGEHCPQESFSPAHISGYGNCYCIGCIPGSRPFQDDVDSPHKRGLTILLDAQIEEYLPLNSQGGFVVLLHEPEVPAEPAVDGVFIRPFQTTYIAVKKNVLHRLRKPHPNPCQSEFPFRVDRIIRKGRKYSQKECQFMCIQLYTLSQCGCRTARVPNFSQFWNINICEEWNNSVGWDCAKRSKLELITRTVVLDWCECLPSCEETVYAIEQSSLRWNMQQFHTRKYHFGKSPVLAKIIVYYKSLSTTVKRKIPAAVATLAALGGLAGMYLGASLITVFFILDVLLHCFYHKLCSGKVLPMQ